MIPTLFQVPASTRPRLPSDESHPVGYTRNALAVSRSTDPLPQESATHGTRADFLQALEVLAREAGVRCEHPVRSGRVTVAIYVSSPYDTWVRIFGQPRGIEDQYDPLMGMVFQTWVQECTDGPITCVGHLCRPAPAGVGLRWVRSASTKHRFGTRYSVPAWLAVGWISVSLAKTPRSIVIPLLRR